MADVSALPVPAWPANAFSREPVCGGGTGGKLQDFAIPPPPPGAGRDLYPVPVYRTAPECGAHDDGRVARDNAEVADLARAGGLETARLLG